MAVNQLKQEPSQRIVFCLLLTVIALLPASCARIDPRQVETEMALEAPIVKKTSFDQALSGLGRMTEVYGKRVKIQGKDIVDNTGTSKYGFGEIPRDITEMTKSALNSIGGNVIYIPYNPIFMNNEVVTGYSSFQHKLIPDIVLSGGITEFDRGLETRERSTDFGVTTRPFNVNESWVPGDVLSMDYSQGSKGSLARITLDFNLIDFKTMSGIGRMQTVNSINVFKSIAEKELGFTIFGPTFGLKGTVKKVQGRHAAIRLLVQASVMQVVGKYLHVPYWKLLPGSERDSVVIDRVRRDFLQLDSRNKIREVQALLFMKGYTLPVDGTVNPATMEALKKFNPNINPIAAATDTATYLNLWESLTDDLDMAMDRRTILVSRIQSQPSGKEKKLTRKQPVRSPKTVADNSNTLDTTSGQDIERLLRRFDFENGATSAEAFINERN
jgi:hypothetical protein